MAAIFISSTSKDLFEHRKAVMEAFVSIQQAVIGMEHFGASVGDATKVSLDELYKADIFVGIYANRYGYRPDDDKSVTEMEYLEAKRLDMPIFIFLVKDGYTDTLLEEYAETDPEPLVYLNNFKKRLTKNHVVDWFTTPADLADRAKIAVLKWLAANPQTQESGPASSKNQINIKGNVTGGVVSSGDSNTFNITSK